MWVQNLSLLSILLLDADRALCFCLGVDRCLVWLVSPTANRCVWVLHKVEFLLLLLGNGVREQLGLWKRGGLVTGGRWNLIQICSSCLYWLLFFWPCVQRFCSFFLFPNGFPGILLGESRWRFTPGASAGVKWLVGWWRFQKRGFFGRKGGRKILTCLGLLTEIEK